MLLSSYYNLEIVFESLEMQVSPSYLCVIIDSDKNPVTAAATFDRLDEWNGVSLACHYAISAERHIIRSRQ